jgi:hypothetical protein
MTIIVSGKLHAEDICFSEIDVGSIVIVWGIPVPIELKTRAFYEVEISITTKKTVGRLFTVTSSLSPRRSAQSANGMTEHLHSVRPPF